MFTYKQFFTYLLTEMYYGKTHTEEDLPENPPLGFLVYPDGKFGICYTMFGHLELTGGPEKLKMVMNLGGVRMVKVNDVYYTEIVPGRVKNLALRTANDLAAWYGKETERAEFETGVGDVYGDDPDEIT
jgi:hypothetical protein